LAANGRVREAEDLVGRIEAQAVRSTGRPLHEPPAESAAADRPDVNVPWRTIFRPPQLKRTFVAWIMFFGTLPAFYALLTFAPTLMVGQGFALASSLGFVAALQLTGGIGGLVQGFMADAWGRKPLIMLYAVLAAVGVALLAVGSWLPVLFAGGALLGFFGLGIFPVAKLYVAEQFPTPVRGFGTGSTEGFGRFFGGVVFVSLVPYISQLGGTDLVLWVVCGILLVACFLTVLIFGRETKGVSIDALPMPEEAATAVEASKTQR
jgi:putative MFS transporter